MVQLLCKRLQELASVMHSRINVSHGTDSSPKNEKSAVISCHHVFPNLYDFLLGKTYILMNVLIVLSI